MHTSDEICIQLCVLRNARPFWAGKQRLLPEPAVSRQQTGTPTAGHDRDLQALPGREGPQKSTCWLPALTYHLLSALLLVNPTPLRILAVSSGKAPDTRDQPRPQLHVAVQASNFHSYHVPWFMITGSVWLWKLIEGGPPEGPIHNCWLTHTYWNLNKPFLIN